MPNYRYTIWYGLTGKFYECDLREDRVRLWDSEQRKPSYESRTAFAARLREARSERSQSVTRYDTRPIWMRS